jgi:hypothetical protein
MESTLRYVAKSINPAKPILDEYMDKDLLLFDCGGMPPTEQELSQFEEEIGFPLPEDFRMYCMSRLGGVYIEAKEHVWPRNKPFSVGAFWTFLYGFYTFGFSCEMPDWMDIRLQTKKATKETDQIVVPCLKRVCDEDFYCIDENGQILIWRHETSDFKPTHETFLELFERELKELKDRKEMIKAGKRD